MTPKVTARKRQRQYSRSLYREQTDAQRQSRRALSHMERLEQRTSLRNFIVEDDAWVRSIVDPTFHA